MDSIRTNLNVEYNFDYITFPITFSTSIFTASINEFNAIESSKGMPCYGFNLIYSSLSNIAVQAYYQTGSIKASPAFLVVGY